MATIESLEKELFLIQNDRMRIINENSDNFKRLDKLITELEIKDAAQITLNKIFQARILALETNIKDLGLRLKKEETKPLVSIPSYVPTPFTETTSNNRVNHGHLVFWSNWFKRK